MMERKTQGNTTDLVEVTKDSVLVRKNFESVTTPDSNGNIPSNLWNYDEYVYTHEEYIREVMKNNENLNAQLVNAELALTELYEMVVM